MQNNNDWRIWDDRPEYGDLLYKRAIGSLDEMECAKSLCNVLGVFYQPGMKILDVGCGAGHYLTSLLKRIDPKINYTGYDATRQYIDLAKKAHPGIPFKVGDIFDIEYEDASFDIVMCNNVLLHLPLGLSEPLSELIRVSRKHVVIRTLVGEGNYEIKEFADSELKTFNYFNVYSPEYLLKTIRSVHADAKFEIIRDNDFGDFDNQRVVQSVSATKTLVGAQIAGPILLDWRFVLIRK